MPDMNDRARQIVNRWFGTDLLVNHPEIEQWGEDLEKMKQRLVFLLAVQLELTKRDSEYTRSIADFERVVASVSTMKKEVQETKALVGELSLKFLESHSEVTMPEKTPLTIDTINSTLNETVKRIESNHDVPTGLKQYFDTVNDLWSRIKNSPTEQQPTLYNQMFVWMNSNQKYLSDAIVQNTPARERASA